MLDMNQKFEEAKTKYEAALKNLEKCRGTYETGPQKEYAETETNLLALKATIQADETALEQSKSSLAKELQASNGAMTGEAKNLLRNRRDLEDLLEQRHLVLQEVEKRLSGLRGPASVAAADYKCAYHNAAECWWTMRMYGFLAEHGQQLCEVLAIEHSDMSPRLSDSDDLRDDSLPKKLLLKEIKWMVDGYKGDRRPYYSEIGKFDLKAFPSSRMLSPAQRTRIAALAEKN